VGGGGGSETWPGDEVGSASGTPFSSRKRQRTLPAGSAALGARSPGQPSAQSCSPAFWPALDGESFRWPTGAPLAHRWRYPGRSGQRTIPHGDRAGWFPNCPRSVALLYIALIPLPIGGLWNRAPLGPFSFHHADGQVSQRGSVHRRGVPHRRGRADAASVSSLGEARMPKAVSIGFARALRTPARGFSASTGTTAHLIHATTATSHSGATSMPLLLLPASNSGWAISKRSNPAGSMRSARRSMLVRLTRTSSDSISRCDRRSARRA